MKFTPRSVVAAAVASTLAIGVLVTPADATNQKNEHRYTICHATSSQKNPYVKITVDYHSIVKMGHDQHQDQRDIIPAIPAHNYAGLNTDKLDVLENDCVVPTETTQPNEPGTPVEPETPANPTQPNQPENQGKPDRSEDDKSNLRVTICHATNSATNPYRMITVSHSSITKTAGHDGHEGEVPLTMSDAKVMKAAGEKWGDVIPAIAEHNYPGKNLSGNGLTLLENDCSLVAVAGAEDVVEDGGKGNVTPDDEAPVVNILDEAASTDVPALAGKGGVADQLPFTGPAAKGLVILAAGMLTAAATYGAMFVRKALF